MTIANLLNSEFIDSIEGDIILAFNGIMSQDVVVGFGDVLRSELNIGNPLSVVNKAFAVFIEMAQNLMHYSAQRVESNGKTIGVGAIFIIRTHDGYGIVSANLITERQRQHLEKRGNMVNNLSKDDLKEFYLRKRREFADMESKGAGLGFIDIVRRSGEPIWFKFEQAEQEKLIFFLGSKILTAN